MANNTSSYPVHTCCAWHLAAGCCKPPVVMTLTAGGTSVPACADHSREGHTSNTLCMNTTCSRCYGPKPAGTESWWCEACCALPSYECCGMPFEDGCDCEGNDGPSEFELQRAERRQMGVLS